jgi:hypothetical protein
MVSACPPSLPIVGSGRSPNALGGLIFEHRTRDGEQTVDALTDRAAASYADRGRLDVPQGGSLARPVRWYRIAVELDLC